jgi:hypothetical protein
VFCDTSPSESSVPDAEEAILMSGVSLFMLALPIFDVCTVIPLVAPSSCTSGESSRSPWRSPWLCDFFFIAISTSVDLEPQFASLSALCAPGLNPKSISRKSLQ